MKTRYFIFISYKGTSYHGWQIQPKSITVQEVLNKSLSTILKENITTTGAGRTDTGVHASFFCAHFDSRHTDLETNDNVLYRINCYLPYDIVAFSIRRVINDSSARYSAISRTYRYYISTVKDPFRFDYCWLVKKNLDIDMMNRGNEILIRHSDFTSFTRLHSGNKSNICQILSAGWERKDNRLIFTIKADRFLRNMVRAIVGTMVDIGLGKSTVDDLEKIISAKDRCKAGKSAPANGLFLTRIEYPSEVYPKRP